MPAVVPVLAVIGGGSAWVGAGVVAFVVGSGAFLGYQVHKLNKGVGVSRGQAERKQLIRSGVAPKQVIFGETLVSGVWLFAEEQEGGTENKDGTYQEWLYNAVGIAGHQCESVEQIYFNETPIEEFGDNAVGVIHNNPTETDSWLSLYAPSWEADMIGKGTLWANVSMLFDHKLYPNGIPTPRFLVRGANEIYDPRTNKEGYTNNAALVILHVLKRYMNVTDDELILDGWGGFKSAANLCDEIVTNPDGSTEKRYTLNGSFLMDEKPGEVLASMLDCIGGEFVRVGGRIGLLPAAYYGPATFTIYESDIIGDIDIQPEPERAQAINVVGGQFIDPDSNYIEVDFPVLKDDESIVRDGGEIPLNQRFNFITSPYQAQRLANISMKKAKAGTVIKLRMNLKGFYCRRGRVVNLDVPSLDLTGEYRVVGFEGHISEGVTITLAQEHVDIYDDAVGEEFVSPPLTNLPAGEIATPTGVQFLAESVGDLVQGKLVWQTRASSMMHNEILFEKILENGGSELVLTGQSVGNSFNVNSLPVANYKASVRSVATNGKSSNYATVNFIVDKPQMPNLVDVERSNWGVHLKPQFLVPVPVGTLFEFWYLSDNASFLKDPPTYGEEDLAQAVKIHTGSSFNHSTLIPDRWQHYWIRTVNLYGQSEFFYVRTNTTRESDLVTTVVERLKAVEIESSNYVPNSYGYKFWGDGAAELNEVTVRGTVYANSGAFTGRVNVGAGYIQPGSGAAHFINNGTSAFYVRHDGYFYARHGKIEFDIEANQIVGDIVTAKRKSKTVTQRTSNGSSIFDTATVNTARSFARTLKIELTLTVQVSTFGDYPSAASGAGRVRVSFNGVNYYTHKLWNSKTSGSRDPSPSVANVCVNIPVPANYKGTATIYLEQSDTSTNCTTTLSAPSTNNIWTPMLFKDGADLT